MDRRLCILTLVVRPLLALAAPEHVFQHREILGLDWKRDLLHYRVEFGEGEARAGEVVLFVYLYLPLYPFSAISRILCKQRLPGQSPETGQI